ncbi:MAG: radical SAM protein [Defluviitaleaceae bacterium]|nr:radical SAM protein [Defluviitaleaceae bacterium]MCL2274118.1 radical SAM protein [Defluviitaleaceae bacterium]
MQFINRNTQLETDLFLLQSDQRNFIFNSMTLALYEVDKVNKSTITAVKSEMSNHSSIMPKTFLEEKSAICYLFMTNTCNLNCSYCCQKVDAQPIVTTKYEKLDIIKSNFSSNKKLKLVFFGGEPLLEYEEIEFIVSKLSAYYDDMEYHLVTNGTLLTPQMVDFIKSNAMRVTVSIDGDRSINDLNRKYIDSTSTYSKLINSIKNLLNLNIPTTFSVTADMSTINSLYDSLCYLAEFFNSRKYIVNFDLLNADIFNYLPDILKKIAHFYLFSLRNTTETYISPFKVYNLFSKKPHKLSCNRKKLYLYNETFYRCALDPFHSSKNPSTQINQSHIATECSACFAKNLCDHCSKNLSLRGIDNVCKISKSLAYLSLSIFTEFLSA